MFGATYRRNASTYAEFSINLNTTLDTPAVPKIRTLALLVFVLWAIKVGKKLKKCTSPFLAENFPSPHQLTLEWPKGVAVDPLSL